MAEEDVLVCKSCDAPSSMLTEEGFCPKCFWTLERSALARRVGVAQTLKLDPGRDRRV